MVVEGLQNEQAIRKGAGVDRPNTIRLLSQFHKDEVLTYFWESSVREIFLTIVLFRLVLYIEILGWLFPQ